MLALTVGHGLKLVAVGVAAGVVAASAVTRVIGTLLHDVSPTDPVSFAAVIAVLGGVGLRASYIPARRALRIEPVTALRSEERYGKVPSRGPRTALWIWRIAPR